MISSDYKQHFMAAIEREIYNLAGQRFNINSDQAVTAITTGQTSSFIRQLQRLVHEYRFLEKTERVWTDDPGQKTAKRKK